MHRDILRLQPADKARLRILFLAKHAKRGGRPHPEDGSHAIYHHEMLETLRAIGLNVVAADCYEELFGPVDADFVIPLLNRGGFQNSEMLAPLLLARAGIPFLGASPIIRGLSDDKHLMKLAARARGVPCSDWALFRAGRLDPPAPLAGNAFIVKPNASSASWGIKRCASWCEVEAHAAALNARGHDAIAEPWVGTMDIAVPVIGATDALLLPALGYAPANSGGLRSYEEKRNLVHAAEDELLPLADAHLAARLDEMVRRLLPELWPFDYGRFEFRYDSRTGELWFMEVNLSCNLWSKKTISRSARSVGFDHVALVETILTHSLLRQSVIERPLALSRAA
ncbi:phosphoribosylglycinamide synthetase [Sphingosinicella sp. LY1275]|uniref:phosphoribosylglycinamide synthetase n=1 Tax=Sphingosinicella sp. LY1275 TaxID=3095379 RepID=UPI002ADEA73A|nr:phosphoribosylglycinamide synthetase [Sphingosinicella sp. LY1275]MEA1015774.1 phosphoribosylglycinamide synthetase [Sphingosinicella sp. LY1275]